MKIDTLRYAIETLNLIDEHFLSNEQFRDSYYSVLNKALEKGAKLSFETLEDVLSTHVVKRSLSSHKWKTLRKRIKRSCGSPEIRGYITKYLCETKKAYDEWVKDFAIKALKDTTDQKARIVFPGKMNAYNPDTSIESVAFNLIRTLESPSKKEGVQGETLRVKRKALDALKEGNLNKLKKIAESLNPPKPYDDALETLKEECLNIKANPVNKLFELMTIRFSDNSATYDHLTDDQKREIFQSLSRKEAKAFEKKIMPVTGIGEKLKFSPKHKTIRFMDIIAML